MDSIKRQQKISKLRRKYVTMMKHRHPNANFAQLWAEAEAKYPW